MNEGIGALIGSAVTWVVASFCLMLLVPYSHEHLATGNAHPSFVASLVIVLLAGVVSSSMQRT